MNRRAVSFVCGGVRCWGMLDAPVLQRDCGVLIVSGGTEIRAGAAAGHAALAQHLADCEGIPVFRYDRRGVGDSEGRDPGWRGAADDLAAALGAFRASQPGLRRVVAYGLCDGASALMLHAAALAHGPDALVLANPWTFASDHDPGHSAAGLRRRYAARALDPRAWVRLVTGRASWRGLAGGLLRATRGDAPVSALDPLRAGLGAFCGPVSLLIAAGDRTGQRFLADWGDDPRIQTCPSTNHALAGDARDWLIARLVEACASRH